MKVEKKKKKSEEQISKYRELLRGIQDREKKLQEDKDMEMEVTWVPGLKETTEQLVKKKLEGRDKLTPWEEFLEKKKDRKKQKKKSQRKQGDGELSDDELPADVDLSDPFFAEELAATGVKKKQKKKKQQEEERTPEEEEERERHKAEMALLMEDDGADAKRKHFNYDKIVEQQSWSTKKRKKLLKKGEEAPEDADDDFQVDVTDPRFQAVFTSHLFNLDPSHPSYKNTKATRSILSEKRRRRAEDADVTPSRETGDGKTTPSGTAMDPGLSLLVKSVKSKTERFQARKKQKPA